MCRKPLLVFRMRARVTNIMFRAVALSYPEQLAQFVFLEKEEAIVLSPFAFRYAVVFHDQQMSVHLQKFR